MSRLSKSQAYLAFGSEIVNEAMETDKEPTSRLMYPSFDDIDNIDSYDWESSVEFEVEEIF